MRVLIAILATTVATFVFLFSSATANTENPESHETSNVTKSIKLAEWRFEHLEHYIVFVLFIFAVIVMKMIYEYLDMISSIIPESCMLIVVGIIAGAIIKYGANIASTDMQWALIPDVFFFILLPPIVLDSAHGLCQRAFADVIGPVMLFAVVATTLNFLIIGSSLFGLNAVGAMGSTPKLSILHCLLFGALIVAVDPVAVLAIFEEIGVDKTLYFLVFGESLFNDAVTIVLYNMMVTFVSMEAVGTVDIILGILSFFTVSIGGALVGFVFGILSCLLTRCSNHCRVLQPSLIIIIAYMSYIAGDLFGWSGIISMISCGILQALYGFHNMTAKSVLVTRRTIKLISTISEALVFLYLGIEVTRGNLKWDTGFVLWSLALCLIARFLVTFALSGILNKTGSIVKRISFTEQFIIGYGGLRGAVAFSLATLIDDSVFIKSGLEREHFVTAALFIILFTIFPMGITMKPLVKQLKIKLESTKFLSLMDEINDNVFDHFTAGIEAITGMKGQNLAREWFDNFDTKYIRPFLQNNPDEHRQHIIDVYEKVALTLHYANVDHGHETTKYLNKLPDQVKEKYLAEINRDKQEKEESGRNVVHGVNTLLSLVELQHEQQVQEKKRSFATKKFSAIPDVDKDNYVGLLSNTVKLRNDVNDKNALPYEQFAHQFQNMFKRKNTYRRVRQDAIDVDDGKTPVVSGIAYQPLSQVDIDEPPPADKMADTNAEISIEMPEIAIHPQSEEIDGGAETSEQL